MGGHKLPWGYRIGWGVAIALAALHGMILGAYGWAGCLAGSVAPFVRVLAALGLLVGVAVVLRVWGGWRRWHIETSPDILGLLLVVLLGPALFFLIDDPPMSGDYTEGDLLPAAGGVQASRQALVSGAPRACAAVQAGIGKPRWPDGDIPAAWESCRPAREWLAQLDAFEGITDAAPDGAAAASAEFAVLLGPLARLYAAWAIAETGRGNAAEAARELARLHSVCRKAIEHSVFEPWQDAWLGAMDVCLRAAGAVALHPSTPPAVAVSLRDTFAPLDPERMPVHRAVVHAYMAGRDRILSRGRALGGQAGSDAAPAWRGRVLGPVFRATFLPHSTIKELRRRHEIAIHRIRRRLAGADDTEPAAASAPALPGLRNLGGWVYLARGDDTFAGLERRAVRVKVRSDLLALELHRKTGTALSLRDPFGKGPYATNREGAFASAGPDGALNTADDIVSAGERP
jgi:hypothetical protein